MDCPIKDDLDLQGYKAALSKIRELETRVANLTMRLTDETAARQELERTVANIERHVRQNGRGCTCARPIPETTVLQRRTWLNGGDR